MAWCSRGVGLGVFRRGPGLSDGHCGQFDDRIIAQSGDGFQRHVPGSLDGPFVVLFEEDGADQPNNGLVVGKDAHDLGSALDLAVEAFESVG